MMQPVYALASFGMIALIYTWLNKTKKGERNLAMVFRGVLFQSTRRLQIAIQKRSSEPDMSNWRPSIVAVTEFSEDRVASFNLLRWLSHHYGFGSYIHYIRGQLTIATNNEAKKILQNLISKAHISEAGFYVDTIVAPTFKTAVAQIVQIPGITGMENNSILFNFYKDNAEEIAPIIEGCYFTAITNLNALILRSGTRHFGFRRLIDIWLTKGDYRNANLMILLAYILVGHPEWKGCQIRVFDVVVDGSAETTDSLEEMIASGRLPISASNIQKVNKPSDREFSEIVSQGSVDADLIILDEPTVGLDPKQIIEIRDLIRDLGKTHTVILSSHILSEVRAICDVIMIISHGKLVATDTPDNLEKLFAQSYAIDLKVKGSEQEARQALSSVANIKNLSFSPHSNGTVDITISSENETGLEEAVFFAFCDAKLPIVRMTSERASLEDVFIELTSARDAAAAAPVEKIPKEEAVNNESDI
jgi:hypothetical protein